MLVFVAVILKAYISPTVLSSNQAGLCVSNLPPVDHAALHRTMKNETYGSEHILLCDP